MNTNIIEEEIEKMREMLKVHQRVSQNVIGPTGKFVDLVEKFVALHKNEINKMQMDIDCGKQVNASLERANTLIESSLNKIDDKLNSYSSIASMPANPKKEIVLVKAKIENLSPAQVKQLICNSLNPNDFCPISITINKSNVAIELNSEIGKKRLIGAIRNNENLKNSIEGYSPNPRCPSIIIRNIDYSTSESELIDMIIARNQLRIDSCHMKILFTIKRKNNYHAVICVSPHVYHLLANLPFPILTGWTGSIFEEIFLTGHCSRCLSFFHRTKECTLSHTKKRCHNCAQDFDIGHKGFLSAYLQHIRNCRFSQFTPKCVNCSANSRFSPNATHNTLSNDCPLYRARLQSIIEQICYDNTKEITFRAKPATDSTNRHSLISTTVRNDRHD